MSDYAAQALHGSKLAGARLIRYLEDDDPRGAEGLKVLYPHTGRAYILGITGPPGAGKSTLIDRVVGVLRARKLKVGVIAVDPSSPFSGGAVLGDRIRMQRHAGDEGVFVRSMATRGRLGGLARTTNEAALVLDAMGYDVIVVETVGVGQDELEIADLAHTTAVICIPGLGDDIQAIKAGILEIGEVFAVNKADRPGADETVNQLSGMLQMRSDTEQGWRPPVLKTSALRDEGLVAFVDACLAHRKYLADSGRLAQRVLARDLHLFKELVKQMVYEKLFETPLAEGGELRRLMEDVELRRIDPRSAAERAVQGIHCVTTPIPAGSAPVQAR